MNEKAKKWIAALRSGEYTQAKDSLRVGDAYCCLGVACELYRKENGGEWIGPPGDRKWFAGEKLLLPEPVQEWLGISDDEGCLDKLDAGFSSLADMNDCGKSFFEIADAIERHSKVLFNE